MDKNARAGSMFADDDDNVVYTTEDGFDIPEEWETSILMMMDLQHQKELEREKKKLQQQSSNNDDDDDQQEKEKEEKEQIVNTTSSDESIDIAQLFLNLEKLTQQTGLEILAAKKKQEDEDELRKQEQEQDEEEENDEEQYEEDEELHEAADEDGMLEGMIESRSAMGMEREETDPSQWKLEEIIMRKSVSVQHDEDDVEIEDDDPKAVGRSVTSKRKAKKEFSYLCKWAPMGRTKTWEVRSLLVEEGFAPQVEDYDRKIKERGVTDRQPRHTFKLPCPYKSKAGKTNPAQIAAAKGKKQTPPPVQFIRPRITQVPLASHQVFFEKLFPNFLDKIRDNGYGCSYLIRKIINIAPEGPALKLMEILKKFKLDTMLLFHGSPAIKSIMQQGLIVPGDSPGVRVANGQAFSHGTMSIYTATQMSTSLYYTRGHSQMFVCVGVNDSSTFATSAIRIFSNAAYVCPVWLIEFEPYPTSCSMIPSAYDRLRSIPTERYFDFKQFQEPFPQKNEGDETIKNINREVKERIEMLNPPDQASTSSAVLAAVTAKDKKKAIRTRRRVLAIRAGVPIEQA